MSTSAPAAPSTPRRSRVSALLAALIALVLAVTGLVVTSPDANAAGPGVGFGTWGDNVYGWHGSFSVGNGTYIYCVQPGVALPTGSTSNAGYWGSVEGVSGNRLAGMNAVISKYGQTSDPNQAAAVAFAVKAAVNYQATVDDFAYRASGYPYGNNLTGAINWQLYRFSGQGADVGRVQTLANSYLNEINTTTASTGGGSGSITFQVDPFNNYKGTITVRVSPTNATGTVTLTNGVFNNGSATRTGVRNGDVLNINGKPPANAATYKISASGSFTAPGSGYTSTLNMYTTPGGQHAAGPGQAAVRTFNISGTDPVVRSTEFLPVLTTSATSHVQEGQAFRDRVTFSIGTDDNDVRNPWATRGDGTYRNVLATGVLYGPFAERPAVSDTVPAGSPVAATASVTTTDALGPGSYTVDAGTASQSGYYTWVWTIDRAAQPAATRLYIPDGYVFTDKFGLTAETSIVPMKPVAESHVDMEWATPGDQVRDTLTVSNSNGLWISGVEARFVGTAYGVQNGAVPTPQDTVPADAIVLDTQTLSFTEPGAKTSAPVTVPDNVGAVVWVWRFVGADQPAAAMFATGWTWQDQFGLPEETTRVRMLPTISTEVTSFIPDESFDDEVTVSLGNGHWIEDSSLLVRGTLYGPMLTQPEITDEVPADAPVAFATNLTFTEPGTLTTDTHFRPDDTGHYAWVWETATAEQIPATQLAMPDGYHDADQFGLEAETSIRAMSLNVATTVTKPEVVLSEESVDTMTVEVANGDWLQRDGENIPVTFTGTLYHVPGEEAPEQTSEVPEDASVLDVVTFDVSEEGEYELPAGRGEASRDGFLTWVWDISDDAQPAEFAGMTEEWTDDFGVPSETQDVLLPSVSSIAVAGARLGDLIHDVAYIEGPLPANGAELTFEAYRIPMVKDASGKWVPDFPQPEEPADEDEDAGEDTDGEADGGDTDGGTIVAPATDGDTPGETTDDGKQAEEIAQNWDWVVTEDNLIGHNLDGGEIITEPGVYPSPDFPIESYSKVLWIETLWSIPMTEDGEREIIHRGLAGVKSETTFVMDVKTYAMSDNGMRSGIEHGVSTWDTATLTGYLPENGKLTFEGYIVPEGSPVPLSEACTAENLAWTSPSIALDGGYHPEGEELELTGEAHQYNPEVDSTLYWVAVIHDELDREVMRGECGDPDETVGLKGAKTEATAGVLFLGGGAMVLAGLSAVFFFIAYRRRQVA